MSGKVCVTAYSTAKVGCQELEDKNTRCIDYWGPEDGEESNDAYYEAMKLARHVPKGFMFQKFEVHQYKIEHTGHWEDVELNETEVELKIERDAWDKFWDGVIDFLNPNKEVPLVPLVNHEDVVKTGFKQ